MCAIRTSGSRPRRQGRSLPQRTNLNSNQQTRRCPDLYLGTAVSETTATLSHPTLAIASNQTATIAVKTSRPHFPFVAQAATAAPLLLSITAGSETEVNTPVRPASHAPGGSWTQMSGSFDHLVLKSLALNARALPVRKRASVYVDALGRLRQVFSRASWCWRRAGRGSGWGRAAHSWSLGHHGACPDSRRECEKICEHPLCDAVRRVAAGHRARHTCWCWRAVVDARLRRVPVSEGSDRTRSF